MWNDATLFWAGVAVVFAIWILADQYWNRKDSHAQIINETERTLELAEAAAERLKRLREIEETIDEVTGHGLSPATEVMLRDLRDERRAILSGAYHELG